MTYRFTEYFLLRAFVAPPNVTYADSGSRCRWCLLGCDEGGVKLVGLECWIGGVASRYEIALFILGQTQCEKCPQPTYYKWKRLGQGHVTTTGSVVPSAPLRHVPRTFSAKVFTRLSLSLPPRGFCRCHTLHCTQNARTSNWIRVKFLVNRKGGGRGRGAGRWQEVCRGNGKENFARLRLRHV